ncbi:NAD(P)/FAD-dependent oxidoreductase [Streptomyces sp. H27-D2]|uniref:NAD(P)/FAD-dependent oxidoreductase n=1 Tax=Streptomyces sp. H27-D2 TaxID=3046304 RepID=UPI002DBF621C|nr:monooxygenase [Streptomyces sp. H27-D2]MEC4020616.1 monooxygenase [Streptomyces sp. H27-D2]
MTTSAGNRAVIVGGGYAGLVTARVLADRFGEVTLIEQDGIVPYPTHRRGTPQSRHPHALLARGAHILEQLFPGLRAELSEKGAPVCDFGHFPMLYPTGWSPRVPTGLPLQTFSRPLLEASIRRRVLAHPGVTLLDRTRVEGLILDPGRERVTGVRAGAGGGGSATHHADLVVIAAGRHCRLPDWLSDARCAGPEVLKVDGRLSYVSRVYRRERAPERDWQASMQVTHAPTVRRGGTAVSIEDDRWLVCLFGADGMVAPADPEGFAAYAASLANPHIREVVATAEPLGRIYRYVGLGGQWNRYDRLRPWPGGLVVLGDALCALNPLYGHGMTVSALQALLLARTLDDGSLPSACGRFQRRSARTVRLAWHMSSSLDLGWTPGAAPAGAAISRWFLHKLLRRIPNDPDLYRRFLNVQHLMAPPATLLVPSLRPSLRGGGRT